MENFFEVKGKEYFYKGLAPFKVAVMNEDLGWIPKTNIYFTDSVSSPEVLDSIADCKKYIKEGKKSRKYVCAYILDYAQKTIYYDDLKALSHANALLKNKKQDNYFTKIVEVDDW